MGIEKLDKPVVHIKGNSISVNQRILYPKINNVMFKKAQVKMHADGWGDCSSIRGNTFVLCKKDFYMIYLNEPNLSDSDNYAGSIEVSWGD